MYILARFLKNSVSEAKANKAIKALLILIIRAYFPLI